MICIKNYAIEKERQLHSFPNSTTLSLWIFHNHSGNLPHITVMKTVLLDCINENKNIILEICRTINLTNNAQTSSQLVSTGHA